MNQTVSDVELLAAARRPTTGWLESCFGAGTLWRPAVGELPSALRHGPSREFLTSVGFPAVELPMIGFASTDLLAGGPWEEDPDELFGLRYPDDDTPPARYSYCFGRCGQDHLMMYGDTGVIDLYDADGWDHAAGHRGEVHSSLPRLAGALGLLASLTPDLAGPDSARAQQRFRSLLGELDPGAEDSGFWDSILEQIDDEYGSWED